jgi:hypothetical protein
MATQSIEAGHSPSTGMPAKATIPGHSAGNVAPPEAPSMATARPYSTSETTAVSKPCTNACNTMSDSGALSRFVPARNA